MSVLSISSAGGKFYWYRGYFDAIPAGETYTSVEYSIDGGDWTSIYWSPHSPSVYEEVNSSLRLRGSGNTFIPFSFFFTSLSPSAAITEPSRRDITISGSLASLLNYNNEAAAVVGTSCFSQLFAVGQPSYAQKWQSIVDISGLIFPNISTAPEKCYESMFSGNGYITRLNSKNILPATTLGKECYSMMFRYCNSLVEAPNLPATTLSVGCYNAMFQDCTSLTETPNLPATTLANSCYSSMFYGCTSLTKTSSLPAITLPEYGCYSTMFSGCTSLTKAPNLPATIMKKNCYTGMFNGCTSLIDPPDLPSTVLAENCYATMFKDCTSLTKIPVLPATTLTEKCYLGMFLGCTSLTKVTFSLSATILADYCYQQMFQGCTSLTETPYLAIVTDVLTYGSMYAYYCMFKDCTALKTITSLPIKDTTNTLRLGSNCFKNMFDGCINLETISPRKSKIILGFYSDSNKNAFNGMFKNCSKLKFSTTKTDKYTKEFCFKSESLPNITYTDAFSGTGGTYTGNPTTNVTYYLWCEDEPGLDYNLYIGVNGQSKKVDKIYIGVNNKAKEVNAVYIGVNNKAKRC